MALIPFSTYHIPTIPGIQVHFWGLKENLDELEAMAPDSSALFQPPYVNFKSAKRKMEWLAVRVLLHQVFPQSVQIAYEESGRPYLVPAVSEFSISHTKGVVSIAFSDTPVGIDVEQKGNRPFLLRDHFLQTKEFDFASVDYPEQVALFMWSAKESVYKLVHLPGLELKSDICLQAMTVDASCMEFSAHVTGLSSSIRVHCYDMKEFVLTVATFSDH